MNPTQPFVTATPEELLTRPRPPLAIADYIRDGWRLFAANPIPHIAYTVAMLVILFVLNWIPLVGQLVAAIFLAPLMAALYRVLDQQERGRKTTASDYLEVLNDPVPLMLLSLVMTILVTIGFFLLVIPGIYLSVAYLFAIPLVLFYRLDFWSGLETSRKLITRDWFGYFVLVIVIAVLNMIGAALFGVGLLVTVPFTSAIVLAAFRHQIGTPGSRAASDVAVVTDEPY